MSGVYVIREDNNIFFNLEKYAFETSKLIHMITNNKSLKIS